MNTDYNIRSMRTGDNGHVTVEVCDRELALHRVTFPPLLVDTPDADQVIRYAIVRHRANALMANFPEAM